MAKKVFLSAGHGGSDPGAVGNGFKEKDLNLSITLACEAELKRHGVEVKLNRTTDVDISWEKEVSTCNSFKPDVAVNIHCNAFKPNEADGAEVWHHYGGGTGKTLANNILSEVVAIGQNSRGAKTKRLDNGADYYYFIREIDAPSVIVECAFVDNAQDIKIIDTEEERKKFGIAIAKGILKTLGIAYKAQNQTQEQEAPAQKETATGKLYRVQVGAFGVKSNAENMVKKLKADGYDAFIVEVNN